jgi:hypothetical protein
LEIASQIELGNLVIQPPFTDITPSGPDGLLEPKQVDELFSALSKIEASAWVA